MEKKEIENIKNLLKKNDYNFREVQLSMGNDESVVIDALLTLIDIELYTNNNPFYDKKIIIDETSISKFKRFVAQAKQINSDSSFSVADRELINNVINMIEGTILKKENNLSNKSKSIPAAKNQNYSSFIIEFVFEKKDIILYDRIIEKYRNEFKEYFSDSNNIEILINRLIDDINKDKSSCELISTVKLLAYTFTHRFLSVSTKENIKRIVSLYNKRLNKITINDDFNNYFDLLSTSMDNYYSRTFISTSSIAQQYNINKLFDSGLMNELENSKKMIFAQDMTSVKTFTLDQTTIGSLEDAISIVELENGNVIMTIYIIDPFAYIPRNGKLELEARNRTKNIYIYGDTFTMFPEALAYDEFSLLAGENKRVIAHSFEFSKSLDLISFKSKPAIIRVNHNIKFSDFNKGKTPLTEFEIKFLTDITSMLKRNYQTADNYYKRKQKIVFKNETSSLSEDIISNLKIFSNTMITKEYCNTQNPFIYLVSDEHFDLNKTTSFSEVSDFFADSSYYTGSHYSSINIGHKKLGIDTYARVTTPARNYAALFNQELFKNFVIRKNTSPDNEIYLLEEQVKQICIEMNAKETLIEMFIKENNAFQKTSKKYRH